MIPEEVADGSLKEQLRMHATRLFATRGFTGTSMRELVEAAGCTKPACYYYFSSKEALYRDVVQYHSERMHALIVATVQGDGTVRERLHRGLDLMIDYSLEQPMAMMLFQRIELSSAEDKAPSVSGAICRADHLEILSKLVQEGADVGEIRGEIQAVDAALVLMGAMHVQFEASTRSGDWDRERIHRTIDLVFDGVANHD